MTAMLEDTASRARNVWSHAEKGRAPASRASLSNVSLGPKVLEPQPRSSQLGVFLSFLEEGRELMAGRSLMSEHCPQRHGLAGIMDTQVQ